MDLRGTDTPVPPRATSARPVADDRPFARHEAGVRFSKATANPHARVAVIIGGIPVDSLAEGLPWESRLGVTPVTFLTLLLVAFAAIGLLLTSIGLYGVLSYAVVKRTREIGIRIALGASRSAVLAMVLHHAAILVATGLIIGVAGAISTRRFIGGLLFGVGAGHLPSVHDSRNSVPFLIGPPVRGDNFRALYTHNVIRVTGVTRRFATGWRMTTGTRC